MFEDVETEVDEDELEVFEEEESDYSSETESEDEANSGEVTLQSNVAGTSGAKDTRKATNFCIGIKKYNTTYKGEPFPLPPEPEMTPFQYFKQVFDDQLIDHIVEQTNLKSVQSTGKLLRERKCGSKLGRFHKSHQCKMQERGE